MKAITFKSWCDSNLSPMAWSRLLTRHLPHLNKQGFFLQDLKSPPQEMQLDNETFQLMSNSVKELYNKQIEL